MATVLTSVTNGVSFGYRAAISAAADTDGELIVDFQVGYPLAAVVQVTTASGAVIDTSGAVITYPADGQVSIADGGSYAVTAGTIVNVIANRNKT